MAAVLDWSLFDRIYVINLPERADRRRDMETQLQRVGLSLSSPRVTLFNAVRPATANGFPTIGTHGCFLSHLGVLRDAAGLARVLILEDDLNFSRDFLDTAPLLFEQLRQRDWRFFYGGNSKWLPAAEGLGEVPSSKSLIGAHFLGIQGGTAAIADYFSAMLDRPPGHPLGGAMHVDGAYSRYRADHPEMAALYACPDLGYQRFSRTDIHQLAWYDNMAGVRDVALALRRMKVALVELGELAGGRRKRAGRSGVSSSGPRPPAP